MYFFLHNAFTSDISVQIIIYFHEHVVIYPLLFYLPCIISPHQNTMLLQTSVCI